MKKLLLALALFLSMQAQSQTWDMNLNFINAPSSPNFGTNSNDPINFFTNGFQRMTLTTSGVLKIDALSGTGNRFLQTDANGNIFPWTGTTQYNNSILFGDGSWRPNLITVDGNNMHIPLGSKFGLGKQNPLVTLDVVGDIAVTGQVLATNGLKFTAMDGFSYDATNNILTFGRGASLTNPAYDPCLSLPSPNVSGFFQCVGGFVATQNAGSNALRMFVAPGNGSGYFELNGGTNNSLNINNYCGKNTNINTGINAGWVTIGSSNQGSKVFIGDYINMNKHVEIGDPVNGITNSLNNIALDIHSHSGSGIRFRTNNDNLPVFYIENNSNNLFKQAFTVLGDGSTEIKTDNPNAFKIGWSQGVSPNFIVFSDGNMELRPQSQNAIAVRDVPFNISRFNVASSGYTEIKSSVAKAISSYNNSNETFLVNKDGSMEIKSYSSNQKIVTVKDMNQNPNRELFVINSNGKVYAREVEITLINPFPDYVFEKDYNLMPISEVAQFIGNNKHLPGFEKAEYYAKNGLNVNDILLKQQNKIEELMLYVIQLEERLNKLSKN